MTVPDTAAAVIDQAFFAFDDREGLALRAASFDLRATLVWKRERQLTPYLRLRQYHGSPPPDVAFSYLSLPGGTAAVVRRVKEGDSPGRNDSRVLIGPDTVLTPERAVLLWNWPGWRDRLVAGQPLEQLSWAQLADPAVDTGDELYERSTRLRDALVTAVARDLDSDYRPLLMVNPPDDHAALLWALLRILAGPGVPRRPRTFSTYEVELLGAHAPRIVLLPGRINSPVADLALPSTATRKAQALAEELVDRYLESPDQQDAAPGPTTEDDRTILMRTDEDTVHVAAPDDARSTSANGNRQVPRNPSYAPEVGLGVFVAAAKTAIPGQFIGDLENLCRHVVRPDQRAELRPLLDDAGWFYDQMCRVQLGLRRSAWEKLARLAFGERLADLPDPQAVTAATTRLRAKGLVELADVIERLRPPAVGAGQQEPGRQPAQPNQTVSSVPTQQVIQHGHQESGRQLSILQVVVALVGIIAVVLSFVAGRATTDEPTAKPTVTTTVTVQPPPLTVPVQPPPLAVTLKEDGPTGTTLDIQGGDALQGQLWLVVRRVGEGQSVGYLPIGACPDVGGAVSCPLVRGDVAPNEADALVVVLADADASKLLARQAEQAPLTVLPPGATELLRLPGALGG